MTCKDCKFWFADTGTCHRFPPIPSIYSPTYRYEGSNIYLIDIIYTQHLWPNTNHSDYCGEFQPWPEMEEKR